jgi:hypothetical protein
MLHHVLRSDKPRSWNKRLDYFLFAMRSVPNATTGVSPYQMLYGNEVRGPLDALKSSWAGKHASEQVLPKPAREYLDLLQKDLALVHLIADDHAKDAQDRYVEQHNVATKEKSFQVGQDVLLLQPTSSNKNLATWTGPATISKVLSQHSYLVDLPNGSTKHCHVNDLRKFVQRIQHVGIIYEEDDTSDLGRIDPCPSPDDVRDFEENLASLDLSHLLPENREPLVSLLRAYSDVFSDEPGLCNVTEHKIEMLPGYKPKAQRPYRIPQKLESEVDRQISHLLETNKIRPSCSPYAHPIVCVAKPHTSPVQVRICTDLRYLNEGSLADSYPLPRIDDLTRKIAPAKVITTLDLSSAFFQIPLRESDRYLTAFRTPKGLFEYNVCPFGAKGSSATFQRAIDMVLSPKCSSFAASYIDDISIFSGGFVAHLTHLEEVLKALRKAEMTVKLSKCKFACASVQLLGFKLGNGVLEPLEDKLKAVQEIPVPTTKRGVKSFLGLLGFYRAFLPHYSETALPLTDMTKSDAPAKFKFNSRQLQSFNDLKQALMQATSLNTPDYTKPFVLFCDSSEKCVGASLHQLADDDCTLRPLAFYSRKFSKQQLAWPIVVKEAFAILQALNVWENIVWGHRIVLYSDSSPLQYLSTNASSSPKLTRWSMALTRFDITVRHVKGSENTSADYFSRVFVTDV